ncbi:Copper-exporting P-type ATPase A [Hartmannibacter diazotrophicus]|uniref:Copper-exporting P-type ATPase A n=1 Tax=Hartmannibacter diazotrophicus TaxID=1482074 RepID=A0A2C9DEB3_9HYPH|nr:heavy metal translocating P-type ATPase [Hartmannibacter diazotrophicus]SON58301.1 Copper-exporting P-type ATPase A [Hartmannibacter diazotrophicus]
MSALAASGSPSEHPPATSGRIARDWAAFARSEPDGTCRMELAVDGITCAACMGEIERAVQPMAGITRARVNLSNRRLTLGWKPGEADPDAVIDRLATIGYAAHPFDPATGGATRSALANQLLRSMGVAAFAAMNVMLLSISIWSGNVTDITPETRDFFHWVSALIALPAIAYAGQPFFASAWRALKAARVNMDVPISIGVLLATGLSLVNTLTHGEEAYFDSALMLLFFLLVGRFLDENMRRRTGVEAETLAALSAPTAIRRNADGSLSEVPASAVLPGESVLVRPGDRVPVDGIVEEGQSDLDLSLVTGESMPARTGVGGRVHAGTLNLSGALVVRVAAAAGDTLLAEIQRLVANASEARSATMRLADRVARAYAPVVHTAAAATFAGWLLIGAGWQEALVTAIAVLIITCPCAIALAVPAVQVVTAGLLFRSGVLINAGDAIERLAGVDTVVFDKTGTLTEPSTRLASPADPDVLCRAGELARASRHPLADALAKASGVMTTIADAREIAGEGVEWSDGDTRRRLGRPDFCGIGEAELAAFRASYPDASVIAYAETGHAPSLFAFAQTLRSDAREVIGRLQASGLAVEILSGDTPEAVRRAAEALGLSTFRGGMTPAAKIERLEALKAEGRKVLMIGDGLNDAPSLAAAHVSMAPVTATSLTQAAADAVFLGEALKPIPEAISASRRALGAMRQNLWIAAVYNMIAVPIAVSGHVTPLIAALAMSGSSLVVTVNALRLRLGSGQSRMQPITVSASPKRIAASAPVGS